MLVKQLAFNPSFFVLVLFIFLSKSILVWSTTPPFITPSCLLLSTCLFFCCALFVLLLGCFGDGELFLHLALDKLLYCLFLCSPIFIAFVPLLTSWSCLRFLLEPFLFAFVFDLVILVAFCLFLRVICVHVIRPIWFQCVFFKTGRSNSCSTLFRELVKRRLHMGPLCNNVDVLSFLWMFRFFTTLEHRLTDFWQAISISSRATNKPPYP